MIYTHRVHVRVNITLHIIFNAFRKVSSHSYICTYRIYELCTHTYIYIWINLDKVEMSDFAWKKIMNTKTEAFFGVLSCGCLFFFKIKHKKSVGQRLWWNYLHNTLTKNYLYRDHFTGKSKAICFVKRLFYLLKVFSILEDHHNQFKLPYLTPCQWNPYNLTYVNIIV